MSLAQVNRFYRTTVLNYFSIQTRILAQQPYFRGTPVAQHFTRAHVCFQPAPHAVEKILKHMTAHQHIFDIPSSQSILRCAIHDSLVASYEERLSPLHNAPIFLVYGPRILGAVLGCTSFSKGIVVLSDDHSAQAYYTNHTQTLSGRYLSVSQEWGLTLEGRIVELPLSNRIIKPVPDLPYPLRAFHTYERWRGYVFSVYVDSNDIVWSHLTNSAPQMLMHGGRKVFCYRDVIMIFTQSGEVYIIEEGVELECLMRGVLDMIALPVTLDAWKVIVVTELYNNIFFFDHKVRDKSVVCSRLQDILPVEHGEYVIQ